MPDAPDVQQFPLFLSGGNLTAREIRKLEMQLSMAPLDAASRLRVLGYHARHRFKNQDSVESYAANVEWFINNQPENYCLRHTSFSKGDRHAKRIQTCWSKAIKANPDSPMVLLNASHSIRLASFRMAEKCLLRLIELDPEEEDWHRELACLYEIQATGRSATSDTRLASRALKEISLAIKLHIDYPRSSYLEQYFRKEILKFANLALRFQFYDEAIKLGTELLVHKPIASAEGDTHLKQGESRKKVAERHYGHSILGRAALETADTETACAHLTMMLQFLELDIQYDFTLARGLLYKGQKRLVLSYLDACLQRLLVDDKQSHESSSCSKDTENVCARISKIKRYISAIESETRVKVGDAF